MARNYSLRCFHSNRSSMNPGVADKSQKAEFPTLYSPHPRANKHRARMGHPQFGSPRQNPQRERGRATQPMNSKKDCEKLMNSVLPLAERMLRDYGEFHPYGGYMKPNGEVVHV